MSRMNVLLIALLVQYASPFSPPRSLNLRVPKGPLPPTTFATTATLATTSHKILPRVPTPVKSSTSNIETSQSDHEKATQANPSQEEKESNTNNAVVEEPDGENKLKGIHRLAKLSSLDKLILGTAIPSMINLAVVPLVNSVDTFWVGRMGVALALAGQSAANSAFFTLYFLVSFLPTITAPLVAAAVGSGDEDAAQDRVCESLFLCNLLGGIGTLMLVGFPRLTGLRMVLPDGAPAMGFASPYLRVRALSMIPALASATGFAAYRGMLNTMTPLKVSLFINAVNLVLDPVLIRTNGFVGAAAATAFSETLSGVIYLRLLLQKKLASWRKLVKPPSWAALAPIIKGGSSMLMRQAAINVGIVAAARRAQAIDPTGVAAAAYGIVMQMYSVGIVVHVALQGTAAALVSSTRAKDGADAARKLADRVFVWGTIIGAILGSAQFLALPVLVPLFSTLPEVREAVKIPAIISSFNHLVNGPVFAGEGTMLGLGCYRDLALITAGGALSLVFALISPLGRTLNGILVANLLFCATLGLGVSGHYWKIGPLSRKKERGEGD